jgi:predicted membrane channel-forming protein YqfA (hemolysin III family)
MRVDSTILTFVASRILQILDHVGIYGVIAGSYTPMLLIALNQHKSARVMVALEWIGAVCGSVFAGESKISLYFLYISACIADRVICYSAVSDLNDPMTTKVELTIFLSMGGAVVMVWPLVAQTFPLPGLMLLALGKKLAVKLSVWAQTYFRASQEGLPMSQEFHFSCRAKLTQSIT